MDNDCKNGVTKFGLNAVRLANPEKITQANRREISSDIDEINVEYLKEQPN